MYSRTMTPAHSPEPGPLPVCLAASSPSAKKEKSASRWILSEESYGLPMDPKGERSSPAAGATIVRFEQGAIEIVSGAPSRTDRELPVYRLEDTRVVAVGTGRLFVRLSEDLRAEEHAPAFAKMGLLIEEVPAYTPHCAWVAPMTGRAADGLSAARHLAALPDVESVEPQLLRVSHRRQVSNRRKGSNR